jgi:tight adherence protein B
MRRASRLPASMGLCRCLVAAVLLLPLLAASVAGAAEGAGTLVLRDVATKEYPRVSLVVGVPAELGVSGEPQFAVRENGETVDVLSAVPERRNVPFEVVLVIDTSGSMKGRPIKDAQEAAKRFISLMPPQASVALVGVSSEPRKLSGFTSDKASLTAALSGLGASGETAVYDSMLLAARLRGDPVSGGERPERTIVLLSDGGDTTSVTTLDQAVRSLRQSTTPVLAVAIQSPEFNQQALRLITRQSGGRLVSVKNSGQLADYFQSLAREIATGYTVTYRSRRPTTKDLEVDVTASNGARKASLSTVISNPLFVVRLPATAGIYASTTTNKFFFWATVVAISLAIGFAAFAVIAHFFGARTRIKDVTYYDQLRGETSRPGDERETVQSRVVAAVDAVASRHGFTGVISGKLERAGIPLRPAEWISVHLALVVLGGFVVEFIFGNIVLSVAAVLLASWAPLVYLDHKGDRRSRAFDEQLPDVLNLLAGGLRTGWGLQQSLDIVVNESAPPASEEFRRAQIEARLGVPLEQALLNIQERVQSEPFNWVVTAIAIQREAGGNLAEVLDNVSVSIRDRESLFRLVASVTAEGRYSGMILAILPFVVLGLLLGVNSDYVMSALITPLGWVFAGIALLMLVVGLVWLRVVSRIEY